MKEAASVLDANGNRVSIGSTVRVLAIDPSIRLEKDEYDQVMSMVGEVLTVDEIDQHGYAWVTKWFPSDPDSTDAHSIALESSQMELFEKQPK